MDSATGFILNSETNDLRFIHPEPVFSDSIAMIAWHPEELTKILACSSWDSKIRAFTISESDGTPGNQGKVQLAMSVETQTPCLSMRWIKSQPLLVAGSIDGSLDLIDPSAAKVVHNLGKHNDAVKGIYGNERLHMLCSLSYDKTIKFWDLRQREMISSLDLGAKVVCSDIHASSLFIGLNNQKIFRLNLTATPPQSLSITDQNQHHFYQDSPLGLDSSISTLSVSKYGILGLGAHDGRASISKITEPCPVSGFLQTILTFQCQKIDPGQNGNTSGLRMMYPIHEIGFHPKKKNTFFTAGGDGHIHIWDFMNKSKLTSLFWTNTPITAARISPDGKYLAYAIGYDWARGMEGAQSYQNQLCVHTFQPHELSQT